MDIGLAWVASAVLFSLDGKLCGYSPCLVRDQEADLAIRERQVKNALRDVRNLVSIKQRALHKQIALLCR